MMQVAVIGVGNMGFHHARNYATMPGVHLAAVADLDATKAREAADRFGCTAYVDYRQMLDRENLQAVSLALPTSLHAAVAADVLERGIALLVEKPLAATSAQAREIVALARRKGTVLAVGHIERFNPAVRELKRRINAGELGALSSIVAKRVGIMPPQVRDANVLVDLAVHDVDIACSLLGKTPDLVAASASATLLSDRLDHAEVFMVFGPVGCFVQVNWITPLKIRELSVTGDRGHAQLNYVTQELDLYQSNLEREFDDFGQFVVRFGQASRVRAELERREPLRLELESFIDSVSTGAPVEVTGEDGVRALEIVERAMASLGVGAKPSAATEVHP